MAFAGEGLNQRPRSGKPDIDLRVKEAADILGLGPGAARHRGGQRIEGTDLDLDGGGSSNRGPGPHGLSVVQYDRMEPAPTAVDAGRVLGRHREAPVPPAQEVLVESRQQPDGAGGVRVRLPWERPLRA